ncbi:sigma-70 family RNA polymerase sigma factor [Piscinibacter sakaiensis]|uniref:RNA polymerase sigma factor n=1 Tax=Piscinibacter sakaiensis TaxID=1547922 RepID=A0A0K8P1U0_PISS1|nr:sigma-70 family RNA polymerase sigma factor [Piscinibacter sakaiensis]GAP36632.1 RNA polymerase sigma-70 factor [Piscinibacter sakaiensis]
MPAPTPPPRADDAAALAALLARVALGDRAAFAALYRATSPKLLGVVMRVHAERALAEDVLQEVYVKVWRAAGQFDAARAEPMAWLVGIARHRAIDELRSRRGERAATTSLTPEDGDGPSPLEQLADDAPGPLALLEQAAEARQVGHCVGELSAAQQQCLALAYYGGLSHHEVADHLALPLGTIKSWLRRGLLALKDCLGRATGRGAAAATARGA